MDDWFEQGWVIWKNALFGQNGHCCLLFDVWTGVHISFITLAERGEVSGCEGSRNLTSAGGWVPLMFLP